jgi:hypothetical protein
MSLTDEQRAEFRKLEEMFTEAVYIVLDTSKSEQHTRAFFEKCLKTAQARYADEHADQIMSALTKAISTEQLELDKELNKKQRMLDALRKIADE